MSQLQPEHTLFTQVETCIKMAAQLAAMQFEHQHVSVITGRQGFPTSPEKYGPNIRTDNFVLVSDSFQECMKHLMEARKALLILGVQYAPKHIPLNEEEIPT